MQQWFKGRIGMMFNGKVIRGLILLMAGASLAKLGFMPYRFE
jgi:hypothetical protein